MRCNSGDHTLKLPALGAGNQLSKVSSQRGAISRSYQTTELPDKPTAAFFLPILVLLITQLDFYNSKRHRLRLSSCIPRFSRLQTIVKVTSRTWVANKSYLLPHPQPPATTTTFAQYTQIDAEQPLRISHFFPQNYKSPTSVITLTQSNMDGKSVSAPPPPDHSSLRSPKVPVH